MSGLVVGFKGPTPDWYRDAPKLGEPWSDHAPTATRLKQVIESLRLQRATLLDERDALKAEVAALRTAAAASSDRISSLAHQLDEAWIEIARLNKHREI